jgi:hypothetical protein
MNVLIVCANIGGCFTASFYCALHNDSVWGLPYYGYLATFHYSIVVGEGVEVQACR